jgi:hypothetical protein
MEHISTIKKNTEALLEASREFGLEVNTEKILSIWLSCHQNVGQNHSLPITNKSFETWHSSSILEQQ